MCKVTHIIPVYNGGKLVRRTVDSVLNQTFQDFELIIIDDGSTDRATVELVDEIGQLDDRIKVVHQENHGLYGTTDIGMRMAQGKYVYLSGQDDYLHPQLFELAVKACEENRLDYLALRWENADVNKVPETPVYKPETLSLEVIDNRETADEKCIEALKLVHIDAWAQFMRRELSVEFPAAANGQITRTFKCVDASNRWGVIRNPLYYYSKNNVGGSLMHKPIYADWVDELHWELAGMYDLAKKHPRVRFLAMCKMHVLPGITTVFHLIKRSNRKLGLRDKLAAWRAFSRLAADFIFARPVPVKLLGAKHFVEYLGLALVYGGAWNPSVGTHELRGSSKKIK